MKLEALASRLRPFETASDRCVPPGLFMAARLDGRGFSRLTKERRPDLARPFDPRVRDWMIATCEHLMTCGVEVVYAHTQSDEISLLLHPEARAFGRKLRKLLSVLAGEASARFSLLLGEVACFDCRVSELPRLDLVVDYFQWRSEDAARNALAAHCYWALRAAGRDEAAAAAELGGLSTAARHELLHAAGTHFGDLPAWQKRGVGLSWIPELGAPRRIAVDLELPVRDAYAAYLRDKLAALAPQG